MARFAPQVSPNTANITQPHVYRLFTEKLLRVLLDSRVKTFGEELDVKEQKENCCFLFHRRQLGRNCLRLGLENP